MKPKTVIFLCHGNICRSPTAEFVLKHKLRERGIEGVRVLSRAARTDEIGSDTYPPARRVLDAHGIPYAPREAARLTDGEFAEADLVAVMDGENARDLERRFGKRDKVRKLMTFAGENRDVADPWYTRDFERTYRDIDVACDALIEWLIAL